MKKNPRKRRKTILCQMLLGILILTSCSSVSPKDDLENEREHIETEQTETNEAAENVEVLAVNSTDEEMLECILADPWFQECVWDSAGIWEKDSEEVILEKLKNCEHLDVSSSPDTLRAPQDTCPYEAGELRSLRDKKSACSLENLHFFPNLKTVTINFRENHELLIEDFTPILQLSQLEGLSISYPMEEVDLSFLAEMDTITELSFLNCYLKDTSFLKEMSQLKRLSLDNTPLQDMAVLENLTELQTLALIENEIQDISFLKNLTELRELDLSGNSITDLTPLNGMKQLNRLYALENEICDLTPLTSLTNLFRLLLDGNEISDISPLKDLSYLNQAGLSDNQITDFSPLAGKSDLEYVSVFGNPCENLDPIISVPSLAILGGEPSEEQLKVAADWIKKQCPELEEYECVGYVEGDLNGDGRMDAAFAVDDTGSSEQRRLFVLLNQADGSFREVPHNIELWDRFAGGMKGDPYSGIWLEKGKLLIKETWGSSTGGVQTRFYSYEKGTLVLQRTMTVYFSNFAAGDDVKVHEEGTGEESRYVFAAEDNTHVCRVDLANGEYPLHKAFPKMELYDKPYVIYSDMLDINMAPAYALDLLWEYLKPEGEKELLPYAPWQKENYERLMGVRLPDYYYVIRDSHGAENEETGESGGYLYYYDLEEKAGEYFHVIYCLRDGNVERYWIDDTTGKIELR